MNELEVKLEEKKLHVSGLQSELENKKQHLQNLEVMYDQRCKELKVQREQIDMAAKKMADMFFGKFSELIAPKSISDKTKISSESDIPREIKSSKKILICTVLILSALLIAYLVG